MTKERRKNIKKKTKAKSKIKKKGFITISYKFVKLSGKTKTTAINIAFRKFKTKGTLCWWKQALLGSLRLFRIYLCFTRKLTPYGLSSMDSLGIHT